MQMNPDFIQKLKSIECVVIGASAGGIEALQKILPCLKPTAKVSVVCILHLPPQNESLLVEIFTPLVQVPVVDATDKVSIEPATIYFAPPDYHLLFEPDHTFSLTVEEPVQFSRPSIDVAFQAASEVFRSRLLSIILTGANEDGASGSAEVVRRGGLALVESPEFARMRTMPEAALTKSPLIQSFNQDELCHILSLL